jgi:hypothetical protein
MARRQQTLAELALRRQVNAANRIAFLRWWDGSVTPGTYWVLGLGAAVLVGVVAAWRYFA